MFHPIDKDERVLNIEKFPNIHILEYFSFHLGHLTCEFSKRLCLIFPNLFSVQLAINPW